jgi:hypothetical protein
MPASRRLASCLSFFPPPTHTQTLHFIRRVKCSSMQRNRWVALLPAYVSIRQHTSAYVSIRQHTSAYVSIRQHTSAYVSIPQHTSAYVSIRQHTSAYVSIRPNALLARQTQTVSIRPNALLARQTQCVGSGVNWSSLFFLSPLFCWKVEELLMKGVEAAISRGVRPVIFGSYSSSLRPHALVA